MPVLQKGEESQAPAGRRQARVALVPVAGKILKSTIDFVDGNRSERFILETSGSSSRSFTGAAGSRVKCIGPATVNVAWS